MAFLAPVAGASGGLTMAGSLLAGVGTFVNAMNQMQMANYRAAVAERNAQIADENAKTQRQIGQIDQQEQDFEAAAILAEERAKQGASGFQLNSTAFQRRNTTLRMLARRDALRIREDAERKAVAFENEAQGELESAKMSRAGGRSALLSGVLGFGTSLISGAASVNRIRANQISRGARAVSMPYA